MNRSEMIKMLVAIKDGRLRHSDLVPERTGIFIGLENEGEWEFMGRSFTMRQIDKYNQELKEKNKRRVELGLPANDSTTLIISLDRECEPLITNT